MSDLVLCAEPGPASNDEPCCREKGHDGDHYFWYQQGGSIHVFTAEGERIAHMTVEGKWKAEEVGAMMAVMEFAMNMKKDL